MLSTHPVLEHRARALVALLALAIAAFALAACGSSGGSSGGGGGTGDAQTLLTQTFTGAHKIDSGKANLQLSVDAQGDPSLHGPIKLAVTGPFQTVGKGQLPKFDLALDVNAQGQGIKAGVTSTSDQLFVNFGGSSYVVPATLMARLKQSYQQSQGKSSSKQSLGALGIHPLDWLKDPTVAGTDTVGGVTTEHITAQIDVAKLLDDLDTLLGKVKGQIPSTAGAQVPSHLSASTRTQIEQAVKQANVDVWTGKDDHTLRKISLALSVQPKSSGSGPKSATVNLSFEIDDLNQPQTISAPTATKPLSDLLGQVQGLLGGALGGSALGGSSGSGSAAPGAGEQAKVAKYSQCLQQANGDATKMAACQSLLR